MAESKALMRSMEPETTKKNSFVGDVLKLVGGTTLAQALGMLVAPILLRFYAPKAFGTAEVYISIIGIIGVVSCLRYELAILLPERDEDAANVLAVSLLSVLIFTGLSAVCVLFAREPIVRLLNTPHLAPYLWLVPLALLANGVFLALNHWNSRTKHFGRLSIAQVSQALVKNGTQLRIGVAGQAHAGGLIGGIILGSVVVTMVLGGQIWRDDRRLFLEHIRWRKMLDSLKRYRKFSLIDSWGSLINTVSVLSPVLILTAFFSQTTVGYYALAHRLIALPVTLIGRAVGQVFFQRTSEVRGRQKDLANVIEMTFKRLVALGLLPAVLMTIIGQELVTVIFGPDWAEAGVFVQFLSLWAFFWFVYSPLSTLFAVVERQEYFLMAHLVILITRVVALVIGGMLNSVYLALGLFAGLGLFMYAGMAIWGATLAGLSLHSALYVLFRYGLYSIPWAVIPFLLKVWFRAPKGLLLAVCAVALLANYMLFVYRDPALRRYLMSIRPWGLFRDSK